MVNYMLQTWLRRGHLKRETEFVLMLFQNNSRYIKQRGNYEKHKLCGDYQIFNQAC